MTRLFESAHYFYKIGIFAKDKIKLTVMLCEILQQIQTSFMLLAKCMQCSIFFWKLKKCGVFKNFYVYLCIKSVSEQIRQTVWADQTNKNKKVYINIYGNDWLKYKVFLWDFSL